MTLGACSTDEPENATDAAELDTSGQQGDPAASGADPDTGLLSEPTVSPLPPGRWTTELTPFPVTFTSDDGWHLDFQGDLGLALSRAGLSTSPSAAIPPSMTLTSLAEAKIITNNMPDLEGVEYPIPDGVLETAPMPDDVLGWLQTVEHLELGEPQPVTVGGLDGMEVDWSVPTLPAEPVNRVGDGPQCLFLFAAPEDIDYLACEGNEGRYYVLEHPSGPVIIAVEGPEGEEFDGFEPEARTLLETMVIG